MSTAFENVQLEIDQILKSNDIAEVAGVDFDVWQTHVFYGIDSAFTLQKNRGRMPFIEYELDDDNYQQEQISGGVNKLVFRFRFKWGKRGFNTSKLQAQKQIKEIQTRMLYKMRSVHMLSASEDQMIADVLNSEPWGFWQDIVVGIDLTYERADFGDFDN